MSTAATENQPRQKTDAEIAQEAQDEEFARQLSMQDEAEENERQLRRAQSQQEASRVRVQAPPANPQQPCFACGCINNIKPDKLKFRQLCGGCQRLLPVYTPAQMEKYNEQRRLAAGMQQQQHGPRGVIVTCTDCGYGNMLPPNTPGPFLCGTCRSQLPVPPGVAPTAQMRPMSAPPLPQQQQRSVPPQQVAPQPSPQRPQGPPVPPAAPGAGVLQGEVVAPSAISVRCGQCQNVSSVRPEAGSQEVMFRCTSCNAVNRAAIR